jgi:hypothetical protein
MANTRKKHSAEFKAKSLSSDLIRGWLWPRSGRKTVAYITTATTRRRVRTHKMGQTFSCRPRSKPRSASPRLAIAMPPGGPKPPSKVYIEGRCLLPAGRGTEAARPAPRMHSRTQFARRGLPSQPGKGRSSRSQFETARCRYFPYLSVPGRRPLVWKELRKGRANKRVLKC